MRGLIPAVPGWRAAYQDGRAPLPVVAWASPDGGPFELIALVAVPGNPVLIPASEAGVFTRFLRPGDLTPDEEQNRSQLVDATLNDLARQGLL